MIYFCPKTLLFFVLRIVFRLIILLWDRYFCDIFLWYVLKSSPRHKHLNWSIWYIPLLCNMRTIIRWLSHLRLYWILRMDIYLTIIVVHFCFKENHSNFSYLIFILLYFKEIYLYSQLYQNEDHQLYRGEKVAHLLVQEEKFCCCY